MRTPGFTQRGGHRISAIAIGIAFAALLLPAHRGGATSEDQLSQPPTEPGAGQILFQSSKCLDCHRVGENGSRLGPDLSDIGARRSPQLLQQAIVAPDAEVLPEHRSVRDHQDGTTVVDGF